MKAEDKEDNRKSPYWFLTLKFKWMYCKFTHSKFVKWGQQGKVKDNEDNQNSPYCLWNPKLRCMNYKFTNSNFVKWGKGEKWRTTSINEMALIDYELQGLDAKVVKLPILNLWNGGNRENLRTTSKPKWSSAASFERLWSFAAKWKTIMQLQLLQKTRIIVKNDPAQYFNKYLGCV